MAAKQMASSIPTAAKETPSGRRSPRDSASTELVLFRPWVRSNSGALPYALCCLVVRNKD